MYKISGLQLYQNGVGCGAWPDEVAGADVAPEHLVVLRHLLREAAHVEAVDILPEGRGDVPTRKARRQEILDIRDQMICTSERHELAHLSLAHSGRICGL